MTRFLILLLPLIIAAALPSCSRKNGEYETWTRDSIAAFDRLSEVLESVVDKESAVAAVPKLEAVTGEFESLARRREALKDRDTGGSTRLEEELGRAGESATLRLFESMMQIAHDPELAPILQDAFRKISEEMKKV